MANELTSNFGYLATHDEQLVRLGILAERYFPADPNTCLIKLRQLTELLAQILAARAGVYASPQESQIDLLRRLQDLGILPPDVAQLFNEVRRAGNAATHALQGDHRSALTALKVTWQIGLWFHRTFQDPKFKSGPFTPPASPRDESTELREELDRLRKELERYQSSHAETSESLGELEQQLRAAKDDRTFWEEMAVEAEHAKNNLEQRLADHQRFAAREPKKTLSRVATAAARAVAGLQLDELATREIIDQQLRQAGWEVDSANLRHSTGARPEKGKNRAIAEWPVFGGYADYVLFVGNVPLGVVEAKRKNIDVSAALHQAKRYSKDIVASQFVHPGGPWDEYRIPFAYSANGRPYLRQLATKSGVWFCDLRQPENISRALDGWHTPEGLTALFKRDVEHSHRQLEQEPFEYGFTVRYYQKDAIRAIEKGVEEGRREMLLAMATGTGKTKTCIALVYRFLKAQRFRRILFLVDRSALGEQAANAFKDTRMENLQTFADTFGIKELDQQAPDSDTAVHLATIQSMVRRVLYSPEDTPPPAVDQYDCIVIDECHRGYLLDRELSEDELHFRDLDDYISKYRRVLDYFDAVKVGLTATPALHTSQIFGTPIYTYSYRDAVVDGYLVDYEPPIQIKTTLSSQGITWKGGEQIKYYDVRKSQIELFTTPDELKLEVDSFNRKVITESFNHVVCRYLAREIDPNSRQKTLIFCVNDAHADMVVNLLKQSLEEQYGAVEDDAVMKITGAATKPLQAIRLFKNDRNPNIAVTVDLLTTGIDVPEICNLVFLRRVNSRILFDQMLGRATRLCDEIGKETFRVFDAVGIFEALSQMTAMQPVVVDPKLSFSQLTDDLTLLTDPVASRTVVEQFAAKLQRKKRHLSETALSAFHSATGMAPDAFVAYIRALPPDQTRAFFGKCREVADILDSRNDGPVQPIYISEHPDELHSVERGYGKANRPQDYLNEFQAFIRKERDRIPALVAVLTRPRELTRKQLRELLFELDKAGYSERRLETAWRETTNQDIAARIVGYIRQAVTGDPLIPYSERVDHALQKMLASRSWTGPQREWLKRIAAQTKANLLVDRESMDDPDLIFRHEGGGFQRLDRMFEGQLQEILSSFNESLWKPVAA